MMKGQERIQENDYTGAILLFNKIIDEVPENHHAYYFRGIAKMELGDNRGALADFENSTRIHHGFSPAFYYLGIIKTLQNDYFDAISNFDKAIALNSSSSDYYNARGYTRTQMWDSIHALEDFNMALLLNPANVNAYLNRSILFMSVKKYEKALADCNKAITIEPANYNAYILRGQIKLFLADSVSGRDDFNFVVSKDSLNVMAYYYLAAYYHSRQEYENALHNYAKVIELNPFNAECYYNRACLYAEHEQYYDALSDFNRVAELNSDNLFAYFYRAQIKHQLNDYYGAIDYYSKVITLYPAFYYAYFFRAAAYQEVKNYRTSLEDKKMAEMLMSRNDSIQYSEEEIASFKKLFEFRTEFENTDTTRGKIQFRPYEIIMKPLFSISLTEKINVHSNNIYNTELEALNKIKPMAYKWIFTTGSAIVDVEKLPDERKKIDSIVLAGSASEVCEIWDCLLAGSMVNYKEFLNTSAQISDTSAYAYLIDFFKGNMHFALGRHEEDEQLNRQLFMPPASTKDNNYYLQSLLDFSKSIEKNSTFCFAYYNRAYVKCVLNDFGGAVLDYTVSIFYNKTFAEAYFNRGILFLFLGEKEKGCTDISKAGELGIKEAYNVLYKHCRE